MLRLITKIILSMALVLAGGVRAGEAENAPAPSTDWPHFGGPGITKAVTDGQLARSWPATGPKEVWQYKVGAGFSAPAIVGGKAYFLDRVDNKTDVLRCLDMGNANVDWWISYDAPGTVSYPGPRSTPAVDDKVVVSIGAFGHMLCVDRNTHQKLWLHNLLEEYKQPEPPKWGVAQSPLLYKDLVIAAPQNKDTTVIALDKMTGKLAWKSEALGCSLITSYSSPMIVNLDGQDQLVMLSQKEGKHGACIFGLDPKDGQVLWNFAAWGCGIPIPQPLYCGEGRFFITGGYNANSAMFKVEKGKDGKYATKQIFNAAAGFNNNPPPVKGPLAEKTNFKPGEACSSHLHTPVFYKGCIYANGNSAQNGKNIGLVCLGLDGLPKWKTAKAPAVDMGDLIIVDDLLVSLSGDGVLRLAEANPEGYKQLAEAKVLEQKNEVWAPLSFGEGKLLVRDNAILKCLDLRAK